MDTPPTTTTAEEIAAAFAAAWILISLVVRITPTKRDDHLLARIARAASFLSPPEDEGTFKLPGAPARIDLRREEGVDARDDGRDGSDERDGGER